MCGRYTLDASAEDISRRFGAPARQVKVSPSYNVSPGQLMPAITLESDGTRAIELMVWGIHRFFGKDKTRVLINTRAENAFGGFWRKTVFAQRCLIPATGFYEWKLTKDGKIPYCIRPKDDALYAFAGIWEDWQNDEGQRLRTYSIMTSAANEETKCIHDRMPIVLHRTDEAAWLDVASGSQNAIERLLCPSEDGRFEMYEVGTAVNNPRNNGSSLLLSAK
ncbi:SOS response-associated peptidase [Candidatus Saccharibacteria bacterium]|nr:MAG: SOS response-associated peptidase [Candidatus Saccharibacteria bacterium]